MRVVLLPTVLALLLLGGTRSLSHWVAEQDPAAVPEWLRALVPEAGPASRSAVVATPRTLNVGTLLVGDRRDLDFDLANGGETPVTLGEASHCSCLTLEYQKGTRLAPGEHAKVVAHLDTRTQRGTLFKPISLHTDEGEGASVGFLVKGVVHAPFRVAPPGNVYLPDALPGAVSEVRLGLRVDRSVDDLVLAELRQDAEDPEPFVEAMLEGSGEERTLVVRTHAPATSGSRRGGVVLACSVREPSLAGRRFEFVVPVEVKVRDIALLRTGGGRLALREGKAILLLSQGFPDQMPVLRVEDRSGRLVITETDRRPALVTFAVEDKSPSSAASPLELEVIARTEQGERVVLRIPVDFEAGR